MLRYTLTLSLVLLSSSPLTAMESKAVAVREEQRVDLINPMLQSTFITADYQEQQRALAAAQSQARAAKEDQVRLAKEAAKRVQTTQEEQVKQEEATKKAYAAMVALYKQKETTLQGMKTTLAAFDKQLADLKQKPEENASTIRGLQARRDAAAVQYHQLTALQEEKAIELGLKKPAQTPANKNLDPQKTGSCSVL